MDALIARDAIPVKLDREGNIAIRSDWSVLPTLDKDDHERYLEESIEESLVSKQQGDDFTTAQSQTGNTTLGTLYVSPVPQIVEFAELHMAALAPLLHESDILRTKIWEAQRLETQGFKDVIEQLNDRLKMISKSLSDNATKQAELKANLTGLLMPKVAPRPPEAFTLEGKMVKVGEMPGSAQAEHS